MKLTTFGMWEQARLKLVKNILSDDKIKCDSQYLHEALLEPVITEIIDTAFKCQQKLKQEKNPPNIRDSALATNKESFSTMLPTLAKAISIDKVLLQPHVEKFVDEAYRIYSENIDYLMQLAAISKQTQTTEIARLYGLNFSNTYPALAQLLPYTDPQLLEEATKNVTNAIVKNCPSNIYPMMVEHIKYMNEISTQRVTDQEFSAIFEKQTGMTMDQYKTAQKHQGYSNFRQFKALGEEKGQEQIVQEQPINTYIHRQTNN